MKQKFYICRHCGNIIAMVRDCGVSVYCCGEKMHEITPGTSDASQEKHVPVYQVEGNEISVTVGSTEHPMTPEHYIEWICLQTNQGMQYKMLDPNGPPKARFALCGGEKVESVCAYCNQHSLWQA